MRREIAASPSCCWEQQAVAPGLWRVKCAVRPLGLLDSCLRTGDLSGTPLGGITGRQPCLREGGSPWKSRPTFLLGSMLWRPQKLVSSEAAGFVSADDNYGWGCPGWANGWEKSAQKRYFWGVGITSGSAKKKCCGTKLRSLEDHGEGEGSLVYTWSPKFFTLCPHFFQEPVLYILGPPFLPCLPSLLSGLLMFSAYYCFCPCPAPPLNSPCPASQKPLVMAC